MPFFRYGGRTGREIQLEEDDQLLVVRTRRRASLRRTRLSPDGYALAEGLEPVARFPSAGVEVLETRTGSAAEPREALKREAELEFAGRCLRDPRSRRPVVYTENFFVKFRDDRPADACERVLAEASLLVKRELPYARNAFFASAPQGTGLRTFDVAAQLLEREDVELCHPELVREVALREAFPQQWHLHRVTIEGRVIDESANVADAWAISQGEGVVIAVIDDGFDLAHEEFASAGKIVAPRDVTRGTSDPSPGPGDHHGTACAGVACADGLHGASGVAPRARLLPIRLVSGLGSQAEADAFYWAAEHGADIISCSWGPLDGKWWDASDPVHGQVVDLPDSTRLAIDWAVRNGRGGKGCLVTWAAGNGNESVENDGYASYDKVIAVAACSDRGQRSVYSDFGASVWCAFPSSDFTEPPLTPGIWTTDRSGAEGYNPGHPSQGDATGDYTNSFGGTSSACPGAAGVAALVLARNPELLGDEVRDVLRSSCEQIDRPSGGYDSQGHNDQYGYGRLDAARAVANAVPAQPSYRVVHRALQDVVIADFKTAALALAVGDDQSISSIRITVDIEHSYIGDLVVRVILPDAAGPPHSVVLHDRVGGGLDDLKKTFDAQNTPALAPLAGIMPTGTWRLEVEDKAQQDTGTLRGFAVELSY